MAVTKNRKLRETVFNVAGLLPVSRHDKPKASAADFPRHHDFGFCRPLSMLPFVNLNGCQKVFSSGQRIVPAQRCGIFNVALRIGNESLLFGTPQDSIEAEPVSEVDKRPLPSPDNTFERGDIAGKNAIDISLILARTHDHVLAV